MRLLSPTLIIYISTIIIFAVLMLVLNIKLFLKHGRSRIVYLIHWISVLSIIFLTSRMLQLVSFDLVFFDGYGALDRGLILIIAALLIYTIALYIKERPFHLPPDLHRAFIEVEELIMIYDFKEDLVLVNHEALCSRYFKGQVPRLSSFIYQLDHTPEWTIYKDDGSITLWLVVMPMILNLEAIGTIVVLYDITEEKKLFEAIEQSNMSLVQSNNSLRDTLFVEAEFEAEKEKNRVINELQDLLVQRIEHVIESMQTKGFKLTQAEIEEAADHLRVTYAMVRESVKELTKWKGNVDYD